MKKKIRLLSLVMAAALVFAVVLTGCSSTGNAPAGTASAAPETQAAQATAEATPEVTPEPTAEATPEVTPEPTAAPKTGTITISLGMDANGKAIWQAVADAYTAKNPGVKVVVDAKDGAGYQDWLGNQLAAGQTDADIVANNTVIQYFAEKKFVDYTDYLNAQNPYTGKLWMDGMDPSAYRPNGPAQEIFSLNPDSVQILWFYNKQIFDKVGVQPPKTWDELVAACDKIKAAGYTPIALPGDAESFWSMTTGWLIRMYHDQYWRDLEDQVVFKDGEYNYDPERDGTWKFDKTDKYNDTPEKVMFNGLKVDAGVIAGTYGPDSDKDREMYENFAKIIPKYVPEGFFGMKVADATQLFIQGKAAMYVDGGWFAAGFDQTMKDAPSKFDLGFFWSPAMTGANIGVDYCRSLGGPNGFIGVINKDKAHNDLVMDFMMFYASPEGQTVRYNKMGELNVNPAGPSLVYDVQMPEKWATIFNGMGYNGECDNNPFGSYARGYGDEQQSVREWTDLCQQYFTGKIDVNAFTKQLQKVVTDAIPRKYVINKYRAEAWKDPTQDPVQK